MRHGGVNDTEKLLLIASTLLTLSLFAIKFMPRKNKTIICTNLLFTSEEYKQEKKFFQ